MDHNRLERCLAYTAETRSLSPSERLDILESKYAEQAARLRKIANATSQEVPFDPHPITLALLEESPLGKGKIIAKINRSESGLKEIFWVDYYFMSSDSHKSVDPTNITDTRETFNFSNGSPVFPVDMDLFDMNRLSGLESRMRPQIEAMEQTADMLIEAIDTAELDNGEISERFAKLDN